MAGETVGRWQNSFQYCPLQIPYQYDSSWPWTLSETQNLGKWLEQTEWKTVLFETSVVALLVSLPLTEPKDHCRIHKVPLLNCAISQLNSIHNSILYICYVTSWISGIFHVRYMPRHSRPHLCQGWPTSSHKRDALLYKYMERGREVEVTSVVVPNLQTASSAKSVVE